MLVTMDMAADETSSEKIRTEYQHFVCVLENHVEGQSLLFPGILEKPECRIDAQIKSAAASFNFP